MKNSDEILQRIAEALSGASFGLRALAGQSQSMGSVELLALKIEAAGERIADAILTLAEAISEINSHRVGKQSEPAAKAGTNSRSLKEAVQ